MNSLLTTTTQTEPPPTSPTTNPQATSYHLRFAGAQATPLYSTPILVEFDLVRQPGGSVLTVKYMVSMIPREDLLSHTATFISDWRHTIPFLGSTDLEPGDLLGTSSSPLARVPQIFAWPLFLERPTAHPRPERPCPSRQHSCGRRGSIPSRSHPPHRNFRAQNSWHASTLTNEFPFSVSGTACRHTYSARDVTLDIHRPGSWVVAVGDG